MAEPCADCGELLWCGADDNATDLLLSENMWPGKQEVIVRVEFWNGDGSFVHLCKGCYRIRVETLKQKMCEVELEKVYQGYDGVKIMERVKRELTSSSEKTRQLRDEARNENR